MSSSQCEISLSKLEKILRLNFDDERRKKILSDFEHLDTDAKRIDFSFKLLKDKDLFSQWNVEGLKSLETCTAMKASGNEVFKVKDYHSAIMLFTKSIAFAPHPGALDEAADPRVRTAMSLAIANRSAALFELKKYKSCLKDISFALSMNYPKELHFKLQARRMKCLQELGRSDEILETMQAAMESLTLTDKLTDANRKSLQDDLATISARATSSQTASSSTAAESDVSSGLRVSYGTNPSLPSYSDCVDFQTTPRPGIYATKDIQIGDIIVIEKPFSWALSDLYFFTNCANCCKPCNTLIPCLYCPVVMFCSDECRVTSWEKHHRIECKLLPLLLHMEILFMKGVIALRTVITARDMFESLTDFYEAVRKLEEANPETDEKLINSDYIRSYQLKTHVDHKPSDEILLYSLYAATLTYFLDKRTQFFVDIDTKETENIRNFVGTLLFRHVQNNSNGIHSYQLKQSGEESGFVLVGEAVYPTLSLINHACDPNVCSYNVCGNRVIVRSVRNIAVDQEILITYGPVFAECPLKYRNMFLSGTYYFTCDCVACTENWPSREALQQSNRNIKCQFCGEMLTGVKLFTREVKCENCRNYNNATDINSQINITMDRLVRKANHESASFEDIVEAIKVVESRVCKPSYHLIICEKYLRNYFHKTDCHIEY